MSDIMELHVEVVILGMPSLEVNFSPQRFLSYLCKIAGQKFLIVQEMLAIISDLLHILQSWLLLLSFRPSKHDSLFSEI